MVTDNIILPKTDKRQYKHLILDNKMNIILIHDKDSKSSSCSLTVGVGHLSDSSNFNGTAHFLEHMLFMGTEKYTDEGYFMYYVNKYGGSTNAYTASNRTTFYFDISSDYFDKAVDIFAQFFITPLFKDDCIEREINAVDSEHSKNKNSDMWRFYQLVKTAGYIDKFSQFSTGSKETLSTPDIKQQLLQFYNRYYSANIMNLTVYSNKDIQVLEQLVKEKFLPVKNLNVVAPIFNDNPLDLTKCNFIKTVPINDVDCLNFIWSVKTVNKNKPYKHHNLLFSLLSYTGEGSFIKTLKDLRLVINVNAEIFEQYDMYTVVHIEIKLTDKGFESWEKVLEMLNSYIIQLQGLSDSYLQSFYNENRRIEQIQFDYLEKYDSTEYITSLQENMVLYPIKYIVCANYYYPTFNDKVLSKIRLLLNNLVVSKGLTVLQSKKFNNSLDKLERFYSVQYQCYQSYQSINKPFNFKSDQIQYKLPKKNVYIPKSLNILKSVDSVNPVNPINIALNNTYELWYSGNVFNVPITLFNATFYSDYIYKTALNYVKTKMFFKLIQHRLKSTIYYLNVAGSTVQFDVSPECYTVFIGSYRTVLPVLINKVFSVINSFTPTVEEFNVVKEEYLENLNSYMYKDMILLSNLYVIEKVSDTFYTFQQQIEQLNRLTYKDYINYNNYNFVKIVITGNLTKKEAINTIKSVNILKTSNRSDVKPVNVFNDAKIQKDVVYNKQSYNRLETDSSVNTVYKIGKITGLNSELAKLFIVQQTVKNRFFDVMRTKGGSGYIVKSSVIKLGSKQCPTVYMSFYVQSPNLSTNSLRKKIKQFVIHHYDFLKNMSNKEFDKYKTAVVFRISEPYKNQIEFFQHVVNEVVSDRYLFDFKKKFVQIIKTLQKEDVLKFYKKQFVDSCVLSFEISNK